MSIRQLSTLFQTHFRERQLSVHISIELGLVLYLARQSERDTSLIIDIRRVSLQESRTNGDGSQLPAQEMAEERVQVR